MPTVKVITSEDQGNFEATLNWWLAKGYRILNSCCGVVARNGGQNGYICVHSATLILDDLEVV